MLCNIFLALILPSSFFQFKRAIWILILIIIFFDIFFFKLKKIIEADVLNGFDQLHNLVEDIIAGSLVDKDELNMNKKYLLVVSARRLTAALSKLRMLKE